MDLINSLKKFFLTFILLIIVTLGVVFLFDQWVAVPEGLTSLFSQAIRIAVVIVFSVIIMLFIRRSKSLISKRIGAHVATVFQFFMIIIVALVMVFALLHVFQVEPTTLLVGGGIASIVIGIVISTFVGNILAGTLLLMTNPFKVGDTVVVNNIPGKILEITTLTTRIKNDLGGIITIPNSAIVQGGVIVTKVPVPENVLQSRIPYSLGDHVYTTYLSGEGIVKEFTPFYTKIILDSGKELTFLNNSVLAGSVAVAKISPSFDDTLKFSLNIDWDAEKTIKAIKDIASSDQAIFKSTPTVHYLSLKGKNVELEVSCKVDPSKKSEAKSIILKNSYLSDRQVE